MDPGAAENARRRYKVQNAGIFHPRRDSWSYTKQSQATKLTRSRKKPKDEEQTAQTESRETMRVGAKTERSKELGRFIYTGEQDTGETQRGIVNRNTGEDKAFKIKQEVNKKKSHTADSDTFFVCRDVLSHYI